MTKSWCTKVGIQIWKFLAVKRYHYVWTCLELCFPALLLLCLVPVKEIFTPQSTQPCHFKEQYLPSAGMSIWLQSVYCSTLKTRYASLQKDYSECHEEEYQFKPLCPYNNSQSLGCIIEWLGANENSTGIAKVTRSICGINVGKGPKKNNESSTLASDDECSQLLEGILPRQDKKGWGSPVDVIKPLLLGKILFTPNDARSKKIVEEANKHNFGALLEEKLRLEEAGTNVPQNVSKIIECIAEDRFEGVKGEDDLAEKASLLSGNDKFIAAVVFHFDDQSDSLPSQLNYSIRMNATMFGRSGFEEPLYYSPVQPRISDAAIFTAVQDIIDHAFMRLSGDASNLNSLVTLQQMPQNCNTQDFFRLVILTGLVPTFIILAFLLPFGLLVAQIVQEKEDKMKEFMLIMSLDHCSYWTSWFISALVWWFLLSVPILVVLCLLLEYSSEISLTYFFLLLYIVACIPQAFLLSCCFKSAGSATTVSGLLYFILITLNDYFDSWQSLAAHSLIPQVGFLHAMGYILDTRKTGKITTWSDFAFDRGGKQSLLVIFLMLCVDAIVYWVLTLAIDTICSAQHTNISERCCRNDNYKSNQRSSRKRGHHAAGVEISGVTKTFQAGGEPLNAVDDVTLQFRPNEITILLGQNGAGKTTLFSLIVGASAPTRGRILVQGKDVQSEKSKVRKIIGFCPQSNTLFEDLTVKEHIWFFTALKSGKCPNQSEVNLMLSKVKLEEYGNFIAKKLSGGTKRKLSVCLAFCGSTKVILLDEPTSGVDPSSRRAIWAMLNEFQAGKTIVMSTHIMEEADEVGDKVAIMNHGKLKAYDTPVGLKLKFAKFYKLVVVPSDQHPSQRIVQLVEKVCGDGIDSSEGPEEIEFTLPDRNETDSRKIVSLIEALEDEPDLEFGITASGMEDVFVKSTGSSSEGHKQVREIQQLLKVEKPNSKPCNFNHVRALTAKRLHHTKRDYWRFCVYFVGPIILLILTMSTKQRQLQKIAKDELPDEMSPHFFQNHENAFQFPYANQVGHDEKFEETFFTASGLGLVCNSKTNHILREKLCQPAPPSIDNLGKISNRTGGCDCCKCDGGKQVCEADKLEEFIASMPSVQLSSGEIFVNVSGQPMAQYLLDTDKHTFPTRIAGLEISAADFMTGDASSENGRTTFADYIMRIWFDGRARNSGPAYLNAINNHILQAYYCSEEKICGISTRSHLLPIKVLGVSSVEATDFLAGLFTSFSIALCLTIVSTSWVVLYAKEKSSKLKLLEYLEGLSPVTYWTTGFLLDYCSYLIFCAILTIMVVAFDIKPFAEPDNVPHLFVLIALFGVANIPLSGAMSLCVKTETKIFLIDIGFLVLGSILGIIFVLAREDIAYLFMLLPHCSLFMGLWDMLLGGKIQLIAASGQQGVGLHEWSMLGRYYFYLIMVGFIIYGMLLIRDLYWESCYCCKSSYGKDTSVRDEDVLLEEERINKYGMDEDNALIVKHISKSYKKSMCDCASKTAVDNLTFGVRQNSCFGLLGVNGAGKTTVLKMLTGEILPSSGEILWRNGGQERPDLGYCPQFDTHDPLLTPEETLTLHCRLQHYDEDKIGPLIQCILKLFDLDRHRHVISSNLSGGTNRKLSAVIAFLGAPSIVLLDEPSTGLDPIARTRVWNLVRHPARDDQSVILVSHVMEECEALCDIIGIMISGKFACIGSPQHLKNKFGNKYLVKIDKLLLGDSTELVEWVQDSFPSAVIEEETPAVLKFSLVLEDVRLSEIFDTLSELQSDGQGNTASYSVSQITIDDVFLKFANTKRQS